MNAPRWWRVTGLQFSAACRLLSAYFVTVAFTNLPSKEQEWLEFERSKNDARVQQRFEEWAKRPEVKRRICGDLSPEECAR